MIPRFSPDYNLSDAAMALLPTKLGERTRFEREFAAYAQQANGISFRYGRSGLYFLLRALGAKNRKVIMPAYTCVVVANAVVLSGNIPVFLDCAFGKFQPAPEDYLTAIDHETAMIIPTHLFGIAEETASLVDEVRRLHPHVFVLQDCAHSMVCHDSSGRAVTQFGDGALFGLNISKLVNSVKGGMLTLQDSRLAEEVRRVIKAESPAGGSDFLQRIYVLAAAAAFTPLGYELVSYLQTNTKLLSSQTDYYDPARIDLPSDFSLSLGEFSSKIGRRSLAKFDQRRERRQEIAKFYYDQFQQFSVNAILPTWSDGYTWSHFPVLVDSSVRESIRADIASQLRAECGVIVNYSVPDLVAYRNAGHAPCPRANALVDKIINLPLTYREGIYGISHWRKRAAEVVRLISHYTSTLRVENA